MLGNDVKRLPREQSVEKANRKILGRTFFIMMLCGVVAFIPIVFTLYNLMIRDHDKYVKMALRNQTKSVNLMANRGLIYDRNMNVLASSYTVETVYLDPQELQLNEEDVLAVSKGLSEILGVEREFVEKQAADTTKRYKIVKRRVEGEIAGKVRDFINEGGYQGIHLEPEAKRYYPYGTLAAQLLGFVNSDNVGAEGLEAYYESALFGTAGSVITTQGEHGTEMLYTYEKYYDATDGNALVLTIDATVQYFLEKNLKTAIEKYSVQKGAFGIVMDVNTGEVLGMATLGNYDPNEYLEIYDTKKAQALEEQYQQALQFSKGSEEYETRLAAYNEAVKTERLRQWRNRAVSDGYEPGSTFKLVTLATALETGAVTLADTFHCGGRASFPGRSQVLNCWKSAGHGTQTTREALANSCNIAFANIGLKIGGERFYEAIKSFGLLEQTGIDLPGEANGYFFPKDSLTGASTASLISASFGQTFKITPLQLIRAASAIVNGGYLVEPYVVSEVLDADGGTIERNESVILRQVISAQTSKTMCELLEYVVDHGTASKAKTAGYRVGGKTGTSEKIDVFDENGVPVDDKMVSFIGVAPMDDPKYAVLVVLDTPSRETGLYISGGIMAAPTVRDVLSDILPYLGVEPSYSEEELSAVNVRMPALTGMTRDGAKGAVKDANLTCEILGDGEHVTGQIPAPNADIPGMSKVLIYCGGEAPDDRITVPDFMGMTVSTANETAQNAGVYLQAKGTDRMEAFVLVTHQDIPAGTEVARGTTVTVEFTDNSAQD